MSAKKDKARLSRVTGTWYKNVQKFYEDMERILTLAGGEIKFKVDPYFNYELPGFVDRVVFVGARLENFKLNSVCPKLVIKTVSVEALSDDSIIEDELEGAEEMTIDLFDIENDVVCVSDVMNEIYDWEAQYEKEHDK